VLRSEGKRVYFSSQLRRHPSFSLAGKSRGRHHLLLGISQQVLSLFLSLSLWPPAPSPLEKSGDNAMAIRKKEEEEGKQGVL